MNIGIVDCGLFKIQYFKNDWIGHVIGSSKDWEPHITKFIQYNVTKDSVFVDVGSSYGWHSLQASLLCKQVYSFEPQTPFFSLQKSTIELNSVQNIELYEQALGDSFKEVNFSFADYNAESVNMGDASISETGDQILLKPLDSFNIPQVDFMKIDAQGYEKFIIQGAQQTVLRSKTTLILELEDHWLAKFQYDSMALLQYLKELGYTAFLLDWHYPADHVCVHKNNLQSFMTKNQQYIFPLTAGNGLNKNKEAGVEYKISYL